ncbi:MAG: putative NADP-dependent oxidoreductase YfmJ [Alphaproteobacteria bacterium MarineAlpha2_Bin1]|nr:MAG: putative NADP-dependent oxidoreductase YfmJ [Alphaproteobacteria bacterium MarineAlpha2_Bin1]
MKENIFSIQGHQVTLAKRPNGLPRENDFEIKQFQVERPKKGEILIETHYLSADPFQRMRLNSSSGYGKTINLGETIKGRIAGKVIISENPDFNVGDFVEGMLGWKTFAISDGSHIRAEYAPGITKIDLNKAPISAWLGILGFPGITAYFSLLETGKLEKGNTVVVSAAAGAVGSIVGQIAKIRECKVIGITGSERKVDYLTNELKFTYALNYKDGDISKKIKKIAPEGIDVFIDNTGGPIADEVYLNLKLNARVVLVGNISQNNKKNEIQRMDLQNLIMRTRATVTGFIVYDFEKRADEARSKISNWLKDGKITYDQTLEYGIENAPKALISMLKGGNIGKQLIRLPVSIEENT